MQLVGVLAVMAVMASVTAQGTSNTCSQYFSGYDGSCMVESHYTEPADVIFGVMTNLHDTSSEYSWCQTVNLGSVEVYEMAVWLLKKLADKDYINGVKLDSDPVGRIRSRQRHFRSSTSGGADNVLETLL